MEKGAENMFRSKIMLAPMAGVGDYAFRMICKKHGADYMTSEMISAKAICYGDKKTPLLAKMTADELPMALQLFGSEPYYIAKAAYTLLEKAAAERIMPAAIDINMGCPVNKIVSNGEGSALMKTPERIGEIVRETVKNSCVPVTVKIRLGWDKSSINAAEIAKIAEQNGAAAICVHARTRSMMYTPGTMPEYIAEVKRAVSVPVIGNGDIFCFDDARRMMSETGCDSIAVARGALGNPFIFEEIKAGMAGTPYTPPTPREKIAAALEQLETACADKGERVGVAESRKHISYYTKGMRGSSEIRGRLNGIESLSELRETLLSLAESCEKFENS